MPNVAAEYRFGLRTRLWKDFPEEYRQNHLAMVEQQLAVERSWMRQSGLQPYENRLSIIGAIARGELVPVTNEVDLPYHNYFANRHSPSSLRERDQSVPFLRETALYELGRITAGAVGLFRETAAFERLQDEGIASIQFCVTSMTRTVRYQRRLVEVGALVAPNGESTHSYGYAFDLDHSGYYAVTNQGIQLPVNAHSRRELYESAALEALHAVLWEAQDGDEQTVRFVHEIPEGRGVFHVAVNPTLEDAS